MHNKNQVSLRLNHRRALHWRHAGVSSRIADWAKVALRSCALLLVAIGLTWGVLASSEVTAAQDRYEYDGLGRLITHLDGSGVATQYQYDAAGNILSVVRRSATELAAPQLTGISPSVIRRGETRRIVLSGAHLQNTTLQLSAPGMRWSNIERTAAAIAFDLTVDSQVALGSVPIVVSSLAGSASTAITVAPELPAMAVEPSPLALPPNGNAFRVTIRLSNPDAVPHQVNLASSDVSRVTVDRTSVSFAAGQTTAEFQVAGVVAGFANLQLTSPTLQPLTVPVFVTADFRGLSTSDALPVGLVVGSSEPVAEPRSSNGPFVAAPVGVSLGPVVTGVTPRVLALGQSVELLIDGAGFTEGGQVSIEPAAGLTLGAVALSADRRRLSVPIQVAPDAVLGARSLHVLDANGQRLPMVDPTFSQIHVTAGLPAVHSVDPLFGVGGETVTLVVRGERLQGADLSFQPPHDLSAELPVVNADGTELVARVQIAPAASRGARTVVVTTPSGQSSEQATPANQFTVVQQQRESITPIAAPLVGVQVGEQSAAPQPRTIEPVASPLVGLAVGAYARAVEPAVGIVGTSATLIITGQGLGAVTGVLAEDAAGLTFGAITTNAEGTELSVVVDLAAGAPRTLRRLRLVSAAGDLPFLDPRFLVSAPLPELSSTGPQVLPVGETVRLTLLGQRLAGVTAVRIEPAQGLSLGAPLPGQDPETQLMVDVQVAADAPTGPRTVIVTTPAGDSPSTPTPANTVHVVRERGDVHGPIMAHAVGVEVGSAPVIQATVDYLASAPIVGVTVQTTPGAPPSVDGLFQASPVGVAVGPVAYAVSPAAPEGFLKGSEGVLRISGIRLQGVSQVVVDVPAGGASVVVDPPQINAEGTELQAVVHVPASALSGGYGVRLLTDVGSTVPVSGIAPLTIGVGALPQSLDSVAPIILEQGKSYTLTVRGSGLNDVYAIEFAGGAGIEPVPGSFVQGADALGSFVQVQLRVGSDAPQGSRVVRLKVPGSMTTDTPTPANTITIISPQ